jgi:hypothetical protein
MGRENMAVFVLVHGAWGGAHGFRKVRGPLREAGHEVFTPSLTGIGDRPPLAHARGRVAAVCAVFRHARVIAEAAVLGGRRFGNLVVAAADRELPVAGLTRRAAGGPVPARLIAGAALDRFVEGAEPITDADAGPPPAPPPEVFA